MHHKHMSLNQFIYDLVKDQGLHWIAEYEGGTFCN